MSSDDIDYRLAMTQGQIELRNNLLARIAADNLDLEQSVVTRAELHRYNEELAGLEKQRELLTIRAPFAGIVTDLAENLHQARWISEDKHLATINSTTGAIVRGFVERSNLARISNGTDVEFIPELPERDILTGEVNLVEAANAERLSIPTLASHYGGPIAVTKNEDQLEPLKSWYHISVDASDYDLPVEQQLRGTVLAKGEPESVVKRVWRRMFHVALREVFI